VRNEDQHVLQSEVEPPELVVLHVLRSIANPLSWIDILQHHNRTPNLQSKLGKR